MVCSFFVLIYSFLKLTTFWRAFFESFGRHSRDSLGVLQPRRRDRQYSSTHVQWSSMIRPFSVSEEVFFLTKDTHLGFIVTHSVSHYISF
ncbi:hypothetical protein GALMADRAFT_1161604 [Galerina marginata CBS 339.88]|uniref:Uncharacterized protein n=1 Tax=Galerina marginata (strain CBS 339.88) TaxID=685588 RepID=A0A067S601_GALM3|nr:hypothetical protein GALMADRAFT_1161604 [Galerina marginata CBS 339.88]